MYSPPFTLPSDPAEMKRAVEEELARIAGVFEAIATGQTYPHNRALSKQQYWDDLTASFNAGRSVGPNQPTWASFRTGVDAYRFSATATNELWLSPIHLDHTVRPNSPLYIHIHWSTAGTNTGVVRWGVEYTIAKGHNQEAFPATSTIYLEQAASGTAYQHMIVEMTENQAISTSVEPDSLLLMRVFRDGGHANDTCTDPAFGLMADVHYLKSHWATKNKAPNFYK